MRAWQWFLLAALWVFVAFDSQAQTIVCPAQCTATLVITIDTPFFSLDTAGAALIASAIIAVWAAGWGIRTIIRVLKNTDGNSSTFESES